jgi:hypothetical protein
MNTKFLMLLVALLLMINCKNQSVLILNYTSPGQTVTIKGNSVDYSLISYHYKNQVSDTPDSVKTKELHKTLSDQVLSDLKKEIRTSGFMLLKESYGAPENERYYAYSLSIQLGNQKKKVIFRSNPSYRPAPEAFSKLEKTIKDITSVN